MGQITIAETAILQKLKDETLDTYQTRSPRTAQFSNLELGSRLHYFSQGPKRSGLLPAQLFSGGLAVSHFHRARQVAWIADPIRRDGERNPPKIRSRDGWFVNTIGEGTRLVQDFWSIHTTRFTEYGTGR